MYSVLPKVDSGGVRVEIPEVDIDTDWGCATEGACAAGAGATGIVVEATAGVALGIGTEARPSTPGAAAGIGRTGSSNGRTTSLAFLPFRIRSLRFCFPAGIGALLALEARFLPKRTSLYLLPITSPRDEAMRAAYTETALPSNSLSFCWASFIVNTLATDLPFSTSTISILKLRLRLDFLLPPSSRGRTTSLAIINSSFKFIPYIKSKEKKNFPFISTLS